MQPTYTFAEIQTLIPTLDGDGVEALRELVQEEKPMYTYSELLIIYQLMMERVLEMWKSESQPPPGTEE
jgi:hypothetical protein